MPIVNNKLTVKSKKSPTDKSKSEERLPHAPDAERGLLGSMLQDPSIIPDIQRNVTKWQFFVPAHATLYQGLLDMWDSQSGVDLITFTQFLRDRKLLDKVGGAAYVTELFTFVPTAANVAYYVEIVREKFLRREMIRAGNTLSRSGRIEGEDLDDLLQTAKRSLIQITESQNHKTLRDGAECLNGHRPEMPAELVRRIVHHGSKMIVGGTSKGRKTMALIDLAVSIATGSDWWGFHTKRGPVCYINFEIQDAFFWYRVDEVCKAKGVSLEPGMFYAWNLRGQANAIERLTDELLSVLQAKKFVLDVIDPIYKALGQRDENKAGDVASMLNELEKIAVETEAAIAFGAHYSKGNQSMKEHIDRIGGSGVFARDPDSILTMTAHEQEECFTVESTLRNFRPLSPFVLKWKWPLFTREDEMDPTRLKKARGNAGQFESKHSSSVLLDQLSIIHGLAPKDAVSQLKESHDISRRTVYRWKEELEEKKVLIVKEGLWFRATKEEELCHG